MTDTLTITEAAHILGVGTKTLQSWATNNKIRSTKVNNRRLFNRADVEAMRYPKNTGPTLKLVKSLGEFVAPPGFDVIKTYEELREYTQAFADNEIGFLLLIGSPGSGKSQQMRHDIQGKGVTWIDNHATTMALYCSVYEAHSRPIVLDDVNHFLRTKQAASLIKALTQTDDTKHISWESTIAYLQEREVPRQYTTNSKICLIGNVWNSTDADFAAVHDRAMPVAFVPSAETIHARVLELGWVGDKEITDFIGENLANIPQPTMREYYHAKQLKKFSKVWQSKMLKIWGLE